MASTTMAKSWDGLWIPFPIKPCVFFVVWVPLRAMSLGHFKLPRRADDVFGNIDVLSDAPQMIRVAA
jgi:hypothetical protein